MKFSNKLEFIRKYENLCFKVDETKSKQKPISAICLGMIILLLPAILATKQASVCTRYPSICLSQKIGN